MNILEEIPNKDLSKILFIKCIKKSTIENFENIFIKFKPNNIDIEQFSETSATIIDDITYLMIELVVTESLLLKFEKCINFSILSFASL